MVTIDLMSGLMYFQVAMTTVLFFCVQILVLAARDKIEQVGDWIIYRGCWVGVAIQVISMTVLALLVLYSPCDSVMVAHAVFLILANTAWFVTMRLAFEFADYIIDRQKNSCN